MQCSMKAASQFVLDRTICDSKSAALVILSSTYYIPSQPIFISTSVSKLGPLSKASFSDCTNSTGSGNRA